jgi:hypothetical protein
MNVFSSRITSLSKVSGLLSLLLVTGAGASFAEAPFPGGGNPPMPPSSASADSAAVRKGVGSYFTSPWSYITSTSNVSTIEAPVTDNGISVLAPVALVMEAPFPGGGNPPMPPAATVFEAPFPGGGNPPMPPAATAFEAPFPGGGNPPMPPAATAFEAPFPGGGNPPMPPAATVFEAPFPGGGNPPMPPSVAVGAVVGGIAVYVDGTIGYPNGDFQFTSGAYLWSDGFVEYNAPSSDFVWTNYAGVIIITTLGDVAANGLPHVEYPVLMGLTVAPAPAP